MMTFKTIRVCTVNEMISQMEFSPDNQFILFLSSKFGIVLAKSITQEDWSCKIEEQAFPIVNAIWSPDSVHIITFSDFQVKQIF